jgi:hypothetical protein
MLKLRNQSAKVLLRTTTKLHLEETSGSGYGIYSMSVSNPYDPLGTVGSIQPPRYDQYALMFKSAVVTKSVVSVQFERGAAGPTGSPSQGGSLCVLYPEVGANSPNSDLNAAAGIPGAKMKVQALNGPMGNNTLTIDHAKISGVSPKEFRENRANWVTTAGTAQNAYSPVYIQMLLMPADDYTTWEVNCIVSIIQEVIFHDPIDLSDGLAIVKRSEELALEAVHVDDEKSQASSTAPSNSKPGPASLSEKYCVVRR